MHPPSAKCRAGRTDPCCTLSGGKKRFTSMHLTNLLKPWLRSFLRNELFHILEYWNTHLVFKSLLLGPVRRHGLEHGFLLAQLRHRLCSAHLLQQVENSRRPPRQPFTALGHRDFGACSMPSECRGSPRPHLNERWQRDPRSRHLPRVVRHRVCSTGCLLLEREKWSETRPCSATRAPLSLSPGPCHHLAPWS